MKKSKKETIPSDEKKATAADATDAAAAMFKALSDRNEAKKKEASDKKMEKEAEAAATKASATLVAAAKASTKTIGAAPKKKVCKRPAGAIEIPPLGCSKCRYLRYGCSTCRRRREALLLESGMVG